jgi:hypothetical protein
MAGGVLMSARNAAQVAHAPRRIREVFMLTMKTGVAVLLLSLTTACGGGGSNGDPDATDSTGDTDDTDSTDDADDTDSTDDADASDAPELTTPTVLSTNPDSGAIDFPLNRKPGATFSEAMDGATLTATTFTLTSGTPAVPVVGTVSYSDFTAIFIPGALLASDTIYTATVTTGVESDFGVALDADYVWSFTTGSTVAPLLPVDLGTAGDLVILAKTGISTVPDSEITGDIGISPAAATYITGFSLTMDSTNEFSISTQVTGNVYAADYAVPTPSKLTTAVGDMELAFTDAAGRAPDVTELGTGDIGGMTLVPGVYKWGTGLLIPTDVTLTGSATDVWIFQIAQDLTMSSATNVLLEGGALPKNVFWQVAGFVDIGSTAHFEGVVLSQTAITLRTGASINGRLLAQTVADIDTSTIVEPAP